MTVSIGKRAYFAIAFVCLCVVCCTLEAATVLPPVGFDSGATEGWMAGRSFANPEVQLSGGPMGAGDPFLLVTSDGTNGPGSIPAVFNDNEEWVGDLATPGIRQLSVDMMNLATSNPLEMRLVLFGPDSTSNRWTSSDAIPVPNDGVWRNYVIPISESDFTSVRGASTFADAISGVQRLMLRHDSGGPSASGSAVRAELGIDNLAFLAELFGDYNGNGMIDAMDLDLQAAGIAANDLAFDVDGDGDTDVDDRFEWIRVVQKSWMGDSNFDGEFNSSDFVAVFSVGNYETGSPASYAEGDWNGDALFDSGDFVAAFQGGGFEQGPRTALAVPEPACVALVTFGFVPLLRLARRHRIRVS